MGEPVRILGRAMDFEPYASHPLKGSRDKDYQMMVEKMDGEKFIAFATSLMVNGKPLVHTSGYKARPYDPFAKLFSKLNGTEDDK